MKIALLGYGKMGKTIERLALKQGDEIVYKRTSSFEEGDLKKANVAIDFSTHRVAFQNIENCLKNNIPVVSGTTAWLDKYNEAAALCKKYNGSFLYASNFSIGVNLFLKITKYAAQVMQPWSDYEVEMEEIHHTQKLDAPSGTAITLAEQILPYTLKNNWILNKKENNKLTIVAKREEDVKGTHIIKYLSPIDTITLQHKAHSREGFAKGALLAAKWILNKKGVFTMDDVLTQ